MSATILATKLSNRFFVLILAFAWLGLGGPALSENAYRDYLSTDGRLRLRTDEEFNKTYNPHTILSLQSPDGLIVLVTSQERRLTLTQLYDGLPSSFGDGCECVGRVLLDLDGEEAASFLVKGMFPPEEESTHDTLYVVANHEKTEYTFMVHYPIDLGDDGFELAVSLIQKFSWQPKPKKDD